MSREIFLSDKFRDVMVLNLVLDILCGGTEFVREIVDLLIVDDVTGNPFPEQSKGEPVLARISHTHSTATCCGQPPTSFRTELSLGSMSLYSPSENPVRASPEQVLAASRDERV